MNFLKSVYAYFKILLSILGFVPEHATPRRGVIMLGALAFSVYVTLNQAQNITLALVYFIIAEAMYMVFIYGVLSENGWRHWFVRRWGEARGYLIYEAILGFIFFNLGASIGYFAVATAGDLFDFVPQAWLYAIVAVMFVGGFAVKVLAAKAVSVDIYYWKDMFLGRQICEFVMTGPYRYFSNPMYGVGQLQAYAVAIWYGSAPGLLIALINQSLIFLFYYAVEKKFIKKIYQTAGK